MTRISIAAAGLAMAMALPAMSRADNPVSTPPAPTAPGENDLGRAKRDADRTGNDAGRAAGNGAPADRQVDDARRDAQAAHDSATVGSPKPKVPDAPDAEAIRKMLGDLTALAIGPDHLDRLTQRFAQPDRDRVRTRPGYELGYGPELDDAVRKLGAAWRDRYGHPFAASRAAGALAGPFAEIRQGPAGTPPADPHADADAMAQVTISASRGLPSVVVPLVREMPDGWKVAAPAADAAAVRKGLADEVDAIVAMKAQWPADEAESYRAITHRVMLALMGQPLPTGD